MNRPHAQRGFTLLIAVIFASVILAFAIALGSLGYKQSILSSAALQSNSAFYAADSALECALYFDQQQQLFAYSTFNPASPPTFSCDGMNSTVVAGSACKDTAPCSAGQNRVSEQLSLDGGTHCAVVTVYKTSAGTNNAIYTIGYNIACAAIGTGPRFVARGLEAHY